MRAHIGETVEMVVMVVFDAAFSIHSVFIEEKPQ